jgi:hypothetical protein
MAVIDRIPVTTPSRGTAISQVNIAIAMQLSFLRRSAFGSTTEFIAQPSKPELYSQIVRWQWAMHQYRYGS